MPEKPRLILVASLWTLDGHPRPGRPWSLARRIRAVAEAGFDGVTAAAEPGLRALLQRHGLRFTGFFAAREGDDFPRRIAAERAAGATIINVQLGDHTMPVTTAVGLCVALMREARRQGVHVAIETHRNTATETPEKTLALVEGVRAATGEAPPLTWDHSHFAVVKHLKPAQFREALLRPADSIQAGRLFHCRPFNGQHAQIPVTDSRGRLTREFRDWLVFAEALFGLWLDGPRPGNALWVCPELGPVGIHGYNLSTMPPSWPQAVICRRELARLWRRLGGVC